jgi:threonine/homoserine/homoserine lactone efflux protein
MLLLDYLISGATFGFAAVVQPGPMQAYLLSRAASHGWRRTLPAAFAPLFSDIPVIAVTVLVLSRMPVWLTQWLRAAGGIFVLYLAAAALRTWRAWEPARAAQLPSAGRSLFEATTVNLLNPNPWLAWSLVLGPLLLKGWREAPSHGAALLIGFYSVMVLGTGATIVLFGMAGKLGGGVSRTLIGLSAVALAAFGCYLLWSAAFGARIDV